MTTSRLSIVVLLALSCGKPPIADVSATGGSTTVNSAQPTPAAAVLEPVVTYAPDARVFRGPDEPVLPQGSHPCAAYPEDGDGVLSIGKDVKPPQRIRYENADLSQLSAEERLTQGILFAEVVVSREGRVTRINIVRSVSPGFDRAFVDEMRSSVFRPAEMRGKAVDVCMVFTARPHFR